MKKTFGLIIGSVAVGMLLVSGCNGLNGPGTSGTQQGDQPALVKSTPRALKGIVSTLAGSGASGLSDGTGSQATFTSPTWMTVDSNSNLYVVDDLKVVRRVTPDGNVSTVLSSGALSSHFGASGSSYVLRQIVTGKADELLIAAAKNEEESFTIFSLRDGNVTSTGIKSIFGIFAADPEGNIYITSTTPHIIQKVRRDGTSETLTANYPASTQGISGPIDSPELPDDNLVINPGLMTFFEGDLYFVDSDKGLSRVKRISKGIVSFVGEMDSFPGYALFCVANGETAYSVGTHQQFGGSGVIELSSAGKARELAGDFTEECKPTTGSSPEEPSIIPSTCKLFEDGLDLHWVRLLWNDGMTGILPGVEVLST